MFLDKLARILSVIGGDMPEYRICLDPERMRLFDISLNEVLDATEQINDNAGAGIVNDYGNEYIIKGVINTDRPEEIAAAVVRSDNRGIVTLADIADVEIGGQQPRIGAASVKGQPAVLITITKQPDTGTIGLTEAIDNRLEEISRTLPPDIVISDDIFRQSDFIEPAHDADLNRSHPHVDHSHHTGNALHGLYHKHYEPRRHSDCHRLSGRRCHCRR